MTAATPAGRPAPRPWQALPPAEVAARLARGGPLGPAAAT
jgi:hypothetical protein